jgi:hypothetical protein
MELQGGSAEQILADFNKMATDAWGDNSCPCGYIQAPLSNIREMAMGNSLYAEFLEQTKDLPGEAVAVLRGDGQLQMLVDDDGDLLEFSPTR